MPQVEVLSEAEGKSGWEFSVNVLDDEGALRVHRLRLSWADYNLWSADGTDEPGSVAEAVMLFLAKRLGAAGIPSSLDASWARRKVADADEEIPKWIRGQGMT